VIYTKDTMKAFQLHIIYSQEVDAVKNNIERQSMGYEMVNQGVQFKYLIDEYTLEKWWKIIYLNYGVGLRQLELLCRN